MISLFDIVPKHGAGVLQSKEPEEMHVCDSFMQARVIAPLASSMSANQ